MAAPKPPVRRRRRPRRGSLARPVNGSLYRAAFLVAAPALVLLAVTIASPAPLAEADPAGRLRHCGHRRARSRPLDGLPGPRTGNGRRARGGRVVLGSAEALRPRDDQQRLARAGSRARQREAREPRGRRAGPTARDGDDRRHGASGRHRDGARRRRQRKRHRGADRARPGVRAASEDHRARPVGAHGSCSSPPMGARSGASVPSTSSSTSPYRGRIIAVDQPRRARWPRQAEHRDRRRPAPLTECEPGRDGDRQDRGADRGCTPPRRLLRTAARPRVPLHALRAGTVRRGGDPGGDDHDRRRSPAPALRRQQRRAR